MFELFVIGGIILVSVILVMLYRIGNLAGVIKGKPQEKPDSTLNKINAAMMLVFMVVCGGIMFWYSYTRFDLYNLPVASEHGVEIDKLFWITMVITGFVFVLTSILLFWFSYRYQYRADAKATYFPDNTKLEIIWTVVPAIVLAGLIFSGLKVWNDITGPAPEDAEVVEIMGYQFAWKARYPGNDNNLGKYDYRLIDLDNEFGMDLSDRNGHDDFIPREIHLPKGKPVLFKIRARDVLHSVFAPHFRLKMDAVPGMPTKFWFVPTKSTEDMRAETGNPEFDYEIACTEICGKGHFTMRMLIVVDEPAEYEKWKREQASWLSKNPDYLSRIPEELRDLAMISAGIEKETISDWAIWPAR